MPSSFKKFQVFPRLGMGSLFLLPEIARVGTVNSWGKEEEETTTKDTSFHTGNSDEAQEGRVYDSSR